MTKGLRLFSNTFENRDWIVLHLDLLMGACNSYFGSHDYANPHIC